ncbi:hypothetical protein BGX23_008260 [Mortierella sp. AD031]|nr:hypothetical protein BGX23_008260 [Mortierella sp. AD031]
MLFKSVATILAVAGLVAAQGAAPELKHGHASLNQNGVEAKFTFDKVEGGMNITVSVLKGLTYEALINKTHGYEYHVHVKPVGANGDCMAIGGHLDPASVGPDHCQPKNLTTCQTGDLSGKYGTLNGTETGAIPLIHYLDTQLSFTTPEGGAMVGRSVVIHNNGTRIACGDLIVDGYTAGNSTKPNGTSTGTTPSTDKNGAAKLAGSVALTGLVAFMMMAL